jgi:hypothetical protein
MLEQNGCFCLPQGIQVQSRTAMAKMSRRLEKKRYAQRQALSDACQRAR